MIGAMVWRVCLAVCLLWDGISSTEDLFHIGSVYCENMTCKFKKYVLDKENATAYGTFNDTLLVSGWGVLDIVAGDASRTNPTDKDIMFAAGFLEGVFTAKHMENNYANLVIAMGIDSFLLGELRKWFEEQRQFTDRMIEANTLDPFWRHISKVIAQRDGLLAGYKSVRKSKKRGLDSFAIDFLNGVGDIIDLKHVLKPSTFPNWMNLTREEAERKFHGSGHCSALVKILPGFENVYIAHSSWFYYSATNRIYKHYNLNVRDYATASKKISFASYAGFLESLDDFYFMESGLVMLQTTNQVFNRDLYSTVQPQSLLAWQRVRVANMMAESGYEWSQILGRHNSGTYNNQYILIDISRIKLGVEIPNTAVWVIEQIPGLLLGTDIGQLLRQGYFASYNIPFFEEIYIKSGYPEMVKKYGDTFSYDMCPRAKMFRRDQATVTDLNYLKALMRSNDYKNDPYSGGSPWGAICARGDLDSKKPKDSGCYDTKVTDYNMAKRFIADVISGPTLGTRLRLPEFAWSKKSFHKGLPNVYNFPFVRMQPRNFKEIFESTIRTNDSVVDLYSTLKALNSLILASPAL